MTQKIIIPITKSDFQALDRIILRNSNKFCQYCNGKLETEEEYPFSASIFYICKKCGKKFKKTRYIDFKTGESYFVLEEKKE